MVNLTGQRVRRSRKFVRVAAPHCRQNRVVFVFCRGSLRAQLGTLYVLPRTLGVWFTRWLGDVSTQICQPMLHDFDNRGFYKGYGFVGIMSYENGYGSAIVEQERGIRSRLNETLEVNQNRRTKRRVGCGGRTCRGKGARTLWAQKK